jgi:hypothetical protein
MSLEDAELSVLVLEDEQGLEDATGQADHDEQVAKRLRDLAVREMEARGILISDTQKKEALGIFPKVGPQRLPESWLISLLFTRLRVSQRKSMTQQQLVNSFPAFVSQTSISCHLETRKPWIDVYLLGGTRTSHALMPTFTSAQSLSNLRVPKR